MSCYSRYIGHYLFGVCVFFVCFKSIEWAHWHLDIKMYRFEIDRANSGSSFILIVGRFAALTNADQFLWTCFKRSIEKWQKKNTPRNNNAHERFSKSTHWLVLRRRTLCTCAQQKSEQQKKKTITQIDIVHKNTHLIRFSPRKETNRRSREKKKSYESTSASKKKWADLFKETLNFALSFARSKSMKSNQTITINVWMQNDTNNIQIYISHPATRAFLLINRHELCRFFDGQT